MGALLWFCGAVALAVAELLGAEFVLVMLAGGALGGAVTAAVLPDNYWLPFVVFALLSGLLVMLVRPVLLRHFLRQGRANIGMDKVLGSVATVLAPVTDRTGEVKINGEVWSARAAEGEPALPVGSEVTVQEVRGATVYVSGGQHG